MTSAHLAAEFVHLPHKQSGKAAEFKGEKKLGCKYNIFSHLFSKFSHYFKKGCFDISGDLSN